MPILKRTFAPDSSVYPVLIDWKLEFCQSSLTIITTLKVFSGRCSLGSKIGDRILFQCEEKPIRQIQPSVAKPDFLPLLLTLHSICCLSCYTDDH